jgi:hypothetical protein
MGVPNRRPEGAMAYAMLSFDIAHTTDPGRTPERRHYDAAAEAAGRFGLTDAWTDNTRRRYECPHNTFVGTTAEGTKAGDVTEAVKNAVEAEEGGFTVPRAFCLMAREVSWNAGGHG